MRAQIALGQRSDALAHYQSLFQRLKQDLLAGPEQETAAIYQNARGAGSAIDRRRADRNPSIAVLPFANHGGNTDQDYFTDGIVEDNHDGAFAPAVVVIGRDNRGQTDKGVISGRILRMTTGFAIIFDGKAIVVLPLNKVRNMRRLYTAMPEIDYLKGGKPELKRSRIRA